MSNAYNKINGNGNFQCNQKNYNSFCVKLDVFNTGCNGIETMELTVYGGQATTTNTNVDLFSLFSVLGSDENVDFLTLFNDWSGGVAVKSGAGDGGGGLYQTPFCERTSLMKYNTNKDIINTIWNKMGTSTNAWDSRKIMSNNNLDLWELLTNDRIGMNTSPLKFTIKNNLLTNTLTTTFEADTINPVTCTYKTSFDTKSGNNYAIGFQTDQGILELSQFDIKMTCQEPEPECLTPLDIVFSMDASNSVTAANWPLMKDFVTDLIENEISLESNIGINYFAKGAWIDWQFTDTQNPRNEMINSLQNIAFPTINGATHTRDAVLLAINEFSSNGQSLNDADRLLVLMTDGKPYPTGSQSPCDLKDDLDALGVKVIVVGIGNLYINNGGKDIMECMVDDVTNDMIDVSDFSQAAFDMVKEKVDEAVCPKCEYTHTCKAMGDPHITTFDGTLFHFQGSGYFDYLTGCNINDKKHLPITISGLQVQSPRHHDATIIQQVIVSFSDGNDPNALQIIFPSSGNNPTFKNGVSAIGNHLFFNNKYETIISHGLFEVLFYLNDGTGRKGKIKFTYKGTTLNIETSDCLSEYICGLCGDINNNPNDDFKTCDNQEIINNYGVSAPWKLSTNAAKILARDNTDTFGESCCRQDLDEELLGTTDCEITTPNIDDCIDTNIVYNLCVDGYNNYCNYCKDEFASTEWLINCGYDICLNTECKLKIQDELNNGNIFTFSDAENLGCLDTIKSECEVDCPAPSGPPVRTLCDDIYDDIINSNIETVPFYRWWNNNIGNHFYTQDENYNGILYNYVSEGFEGYIWKNAVSGGYTVPFYRFKSNDDEDDFYTDNGNGIDSVDKDDHTHIITNYVYQGRAGYIMKTHCPNFNQPLYRYWSNLHKDHFYTTEYRDNYNEYVFENVAGYVARKKIV
jgi:hypothetical protein